ncbi:MAG: FAD-dependent oxidoreductase [Nitrospira sp.]
MTTARTESIVVLGTTLASLVAACKLAQQGYQLTVIEHPDWADEPSASAHILGCHREMRALLRSLPDIEPAPQAQATPLEFQLPDGRIVSYRPTTLPGSLHWIAGLVRFRGLSWNDRWQLLSYLERVWEQESSIPTALDQRTADVWLASIGQSPSARNAIWSPLVRFLTGNALTDLSAATCARVLAPPFLTNAHGAHGTKLTDALLHRLRERLRADLSTQGTRFLAQTDLPHIQFTQHRIDHLRLWDGTVIHGTWFLSGMPHYALLKLLPDRLLTRYGYFSQLSELTDLPGVSVQLAGSTPATANRLILLPGHTFQYVTVSQADPSTTLYELAAVGDVPFIERTDTDLIDLAKQAIRRLFPTPPGTDLRPTGFQRRAHAALSLKSGTAILRPIPQSPIQNFLVAGAWTDTGWPSNYESAVVSARRCVDIIAGT